MARAPALVAAPPPVVWAQEAVLIQDEAPAAVASRAGAVPESLVSARAMAAASASASAWPLSSASAGTRTATARWP